MQFPFVENLQSPGGNTAANQFRIKIDGVEYFQSYNSFIFSIDRANKKITVDQRYFCYSNTTSKYQPQFFYDEEMYKEIKKRFKKGNLETFEYNYWTIEFTDLNPLPY